MPIYEFQCQNCETEFEELLPSSRMDEAIPCPDCGGKKVQRLLSAFGAFTKTASACDPACGPADDGRFM
jgi:putative FmdB family regulatory protein